MKRASGILMHISSLPSNYGIGTLGLPAYDFAAFLKKSGQSYWQVLPLGPTGYADSPYMSASSFAGNSNLIDLDTLMYQGYINQDEINAWDFGQDEQHVDFEKVKRARNDLLRKAFSRINDKTSQELDAFFEKKASWLPDYCLYMALKEDQGEAPWYEWPEGLKNRNPEDMKLAEERLKDEIRFYGFVQYLFFNQLEQLRFYLKELDIKLIGDLPIYVPYDSADAWANYDIFMTDEEGRPEAVSGVPPDYFSEDGQLWGSPVYDWEYLKKTGYKFWLERMSAQTEIFDVVRFDHFRALASFWAIPYGETTAKNGKWIKGPGIEFVELLKENFPDTGIIAEDLGMLTDDVRDLLKESGLPGMKVLQFAFSRDANSDYLPHNHVKNCVVYAGTHDNMTSEQFFSECGDDAEFASEYLGGRGADAFIRCGMSSVADLFVSTMQDWLYKNSDGRMNTPGIAEGNWHWRMQRGADNDTLAEKIRNITIRYGRV